MHDVSPSLPIGFHSGQVVIRTSGILAETGSSQQSANALLGARRAQFKRVFHATPPGLEVKG